VREGGKRDALQRILTNLINKLPTFWIRRGSLAIGGDGCEPFLIVAAAAAGSPIQQDDNVFRYGSPQRLDMRGQSISDLGSWPL
jgi:hypothetical protein